MFWTLPALREVFRLRAGRGNSSDCTRTTPADIRWVGTWLQATPFLYTSRLAGCEITDFQLRPFFSPLTTGPSGFLGDPVGDERLVNRMHADIIVAVRWTTLFNLIKNLPLCSVFTQSAFCGSSYEISVSADFPWDDGWFLQQLYLVHQWYFQKVSEHMNVNVKLMSYSKVIISTFR